MPGRTTVLANGEIYHIFSRGINRQPTFLNRYDYRRALLAIRLYQYLQPPVSLSQLLEASQEDRQKLFSAAAKTGLSVTILAFCLMPNHFHFLLRQEADNGISKFMSNFQNSYTRYFNTRNQRDGALFSGRFKAIRVESEQQLEHLSRYIHLNPYSSYVVKTQQQLLKYPWSSLPEYLNLQTAIISQPKIILNSFSSPKEYRKFILNQADYQRHLEEIKHLFLEK